MGSEERDKQQNDEKDQGYEGNKNYLEWTVFVIGLVLLITILGYLSYKTYTHKPSPADIIVDYTLSPSQNSPYRFHLSASNTGGETAENVIIEMELMSADTTLEKSEIQFQYIPQSSKREGFVIFKTNPAESDSISARVLSFNKP